MYLSMMPTTSSPCSTIVPRSSQITRLHVAQFVDPRVALDPELGVAGRQRLVDQQDLVVLGRGDREPQPRAHARRVGLHRQVDELAHAGEVHDLGVLGLDVGLGHPHRQAPEHHVPLAGEVLHQGGVDAEQGGVADRVDRAVLGREQPGDRAQQRGLARAVPADDADRVAAVGDERHAADGVHLADRRPRLPAEYAEQGGRRGAAVPARAVDAVDDVQAVDDDGRLGGAARAAGLVGEHRAGRGACALRRLSHGRSSPPSARSTRSRAAARRPPTRPRTATGGWKSRWDGSRRCRTG